MASKSLYWAEPICLLPSSRPYAFSYTPILASCLPRPAVHTHTQVVTRGELWYRGVPLPWYSQEKKNFISWYRILSVWTCLWWAAHARVSISCERAQALGLSLGQQSPWAGHACGSCRPAARVHLSWSEGGEAGRAHTGAAPPRPPSPWQESRPGPKRATPRPAARPPLTCRRAQGDPPVPPAELPQLLLVLLQPPGFGHRWRGGGWTHSKSGGCHTGPRPGASHSVAGQGRHVPSARPPGPAPHLRPHRPASPGELAARAAPRCYRRGERGRGGSQWRPFLPIRGSPASAGNPAAAWHRHKRGRRRRRQGEVPGGRRRAALRCGGQLAVPRGAEPGWRARARLGSAGASPPALSGRRVTPSSPVLRPGGWGLPPSRRGSGGDKGSSCERAETAGRAAGWSSSPARPGELGPGWPLGWGKAGGQTAAGGNSRPGGCISWRGAP